MAAAVETEAEIDQFMQHSGAGIPLLFDAGHLAFAGGDCLRAIDKHHARIAHVHTKDMRMQVIAGLDRSQAVVPRRRGAGCLYRAGRRVAGFRGHCRRLAEHGYEGWFVVEAEQDPRRPRLSKWPGSAMRN